MSADSLMSNHADSALVPIDFGDGYYMPYTVHVSDDGHADIEWREELRFHRELCDADHARYPHNPNFRPWSTYSEGGWLTSESEAVLVAELRKLLSMEDVETVESGDADGGDGYVAFSIRTDYREGETVQEWTDRIGWHVIATLTNATDPGTFMFPYLFSAMLYRDAA
jgi:hypothetical protein